MRWPAVCPPLTAPLPLAVVVPADAQRAAHPFCGPGRQRQPRAGAQLCWLVLGLALLRCMRRARIWWSCPPARYMREKGRHGRLLAASCCAPGCCPAMPPPLMPLLHANPLRRRARSSTCPSTLATRARPRCCTPWARTRRPARCAGRCIVRRGWAWPGAGLEAAGCFDLEKTNLRTIAPARRSTAAPPRPPTPAIPWPLPPCRPPGHHARHRGRQLPQRVGHAQALPPHQDVCARL